MTTLVSKHTDGTQGDDLSTSPVVSADGEHIVFTSRAENLVDGDFNNAADVFMHDTATGITKLISRHTDGTQADSDSFGATVSAGGRFVAYHSASANLVDGDVNLTFDIFLFDNATNTTTLISTAADGTAANQASFNPVISADGRFIVYESLASNIVVGDVVGTADLFLYDALTGTTTLISKNSDGIFGNGTSKGQSISADGRYITYDSAATNLVTDDTNNANDVFLFDRVTGTTTLVSKGPDGAVGTGPSDNASISANGKFIAYESSSTNLVGSDTNNAINDVFVYDVENDTTTVVSKSTAGTQGNFNSFKPSISANGQYVAFESEATNLVSGDTNVVRDIFVHNRENGETEMVSVPSGSSALANDVSLLASISGDGRVVAYASDATNLINMDSNAQSDVFAATTPNWTSSSSWAYGWNTGWYVGWGVGWYTGWEIGWYYGWGVGWHVGWYYGWYYGWYLGASGWTVGWSVGWANGWTVGWNVGWHNGWHVGWLFGWNNGWHFGDNVGWDLAS
ncbi:MAG: calcium-binding protein [Pseudomonadota bacterium]